MKSITIKKIDIDKDYYITLRRVLDSYYIIYEYSYMILDTQVKFSMNLKAEEAFKTFWFYRHELNFKKHSSYKSTESPGGYYE